MVDFGGWDMPVNYGSQIEEHHAVRNAAGVFDVSHMCVVDLIGARTRELLSRLLANDVARLKVSGSALYSCMLNEQGGVIDDLIAYFLAEDHFRLVVNAGTRDKDLAWIGGHASSVDVRLLVRRDLAMLAVQGPLAREHVAMLMSSEAASAAMALQPFFGTQIGEWFIARTGYTGEDGFEIMLPAGDAGKLWWGLNAAGVRSCGLGARDTLRLEAGMNLYGNDMDEHTNPLESGLAWTVAFAPTQRDFIGRAALEAIRARGSEHKRVGLVLDERGRAAQPSTCHCVRCGRGRGHERHVLADAVALHRPGAGAGGDRHLGAGRGAWPAVAGADRAAAVRAPRPACDSSAIVIGFRI